MKKNIFFAFASFVTIGTITNLKAAQQLDPWVEELRNNGKSFLCFDEQQKFMQEQQEFDKQLQITRQAQRKYEMCVPPYSFFSITTQQHNSIISTTNFRNNIATAILAQYKDNTWFAGMGSYPGNALQHHARPLTKILDMLIEQQDLIKLLRFIVVHKTTTDNTLYSAFLAGLVGGTAEKINKPIKMWPFEYKEQNAVPFSPENPKDFEIYLNPDGTGFVYLNTTQDYIELPS